MHDRLLALVCSQGPVYSETEANAETVKIVKVRRKKTTQTDVENAHASQSEEISRRQEICRYSPAASSECCM